MSCVVPSQCVPCLALEEVAEAKVDGNQHREKFWADYEEKQRRRLVSVADDSAGIAEIAKEVAEKSKKEWTCVQQQLTLHFLGQNKCYFPPWLTQLEEEEIKVNSSR